MAVFRNILRTAAATPLRSSWRPWTSWARPKPQIICRRAIMAAFPGGLPRVPESIQSASADFSDDILEALEPLDREFFAYPHNLTELLYTYVGKHPEEFGAVPKAD